LEIIQPDNILVMYQNGAKLLREKYKPIEGSEDFPSSKEIDHCKIKIGEKIVNVYYIIHPCKRPNPPRRGGSDIKLFKDFADCLIKSKR
jgi:hypothetical protein